MLTEIYKKEKEVKKYRNGEIEWINGLHGSVILKDNVYKHRESGISISLNNDDDVTIYCTSTVLGKDNSKYQIMPFFIEKENYTVFQFDLVESSTSIRKVLLAKNLKKLLRLNMGIH